MIRSLYKDLIKVESSLQTTDSFGGRTDNYTTTYQNIPARIENIGTLMSPNNYQYRQEGERDGSPFNVYVDGMFSIKLKDRITWISSNGKYVNQIIGTVLNTNIGYGINNKIDHYELELEKI